MPDDNSVRHFPARRWRSSRADGSRCDALVHRRGSDTALGAALYSKVAHQAYVDWSLVDVAGCICHCRTGDRASRRLRDMPGSRVVYSARPTRFSGAIRWVLLASICVLGLVVSELVSRRLIRDWQRLAVLPTAFERQPSPREPESDLSKPAPRAGNTASGNHKTISANGVLYFVVIGESSTQGEPYHPWLSVGQIVAWQLERVFPGRRIRVDIRADGGLCLEQAILTLRELKQRPDAIIVFSGQNEFITRFWWARIVRHYIDESPEIPSALLERIRSSSSTLRLIVDTLDRHRVSLPPPPHITRELVDHPSFTPHEFAFLLDDFHRRLDALATYCNRIGALPILIVPASNDGGFEPSRSVLAASTPASERAAFAREFQAIRAAESADVNSAIAGYRRLVEQHPEFAESHYRLARLLVKISNWEEAERHFVFARELDHLVLRCPNEFRAAIRTVAQEHHAVLIDGPHVLARRSAHGIVDDRLFHDAQHMNLEGYVALAQETLVQLAKRRLFGWPESVPVPHIDLKGCADHYGLDAAKWAKVCDRSAVFYGTTAYVRFDPSERIEVMRRYLQAARDLAAGQPLLRASLPSLDLPIPIPGVSSSPVVDSASRPSS